MKTLNSIQHANANKIVREHEEALNDAKLSIKTIKEIIQGCDAERLPRTIEFYASEIRFKSEYIRLLEAIDKDVLDQLFENWTAELDKWIAGFTGAAIANMEDPHLHPDDARAYAAVYRYVVNWRVRAATFAG